MKHMMAELFKTSRWYLLSAKARSEKTAYTISTTRAMRRFYQHWLIIYKYNLEINMKMGLIYLILH